MNPMGGHGLSNEVIKYTLGMLLGVVTIMRWSINKIISTLLAVFGTYVHVLDMITMNNGEGFTAQKVHQYYNKANPTPSPDHLNYKLS